MQDQADLKDNVSNDLHSIAGSLKTLAANSTAALAQGTALLQAFGTLNTTLTALIIDASDVAALTHQLAASEQALQAAIAANSTTSPVSQTERKTKMANPIFDQLAQQVAATVGAEQSATVLITGFAARIQAAVDAALAGGATAAELAAAIQAQIDALKASTDPLAAAVAANPAPVQVKKP